ncbi:MAG: polysulfide reductase NrfD [Sandaracinaceae bacterium]|nr:polysulfide reductase NrfD [Sandaracinaceae bacterium]MBK7150638.1 polysulfide reductase NrfD [Sandaracinaceae bacterium]MBK7775888.1 polysulfide reductase NrfD [Sandaracinaceae bacterium]MBK8412660.1 polysulfide reductase NrfD [Sandaracinaceae bacterium]
MFVLTAIALVGANAWANQVVEGMGVTNMTDHVSWGLYIANFTFAVGLAAGGVMMVIPAYVYDDHEMHRVVIIGEVLAIAAIVMCLMFVVADLGRPDRFWHMIPGIGRFNWPMSMLTWDVLVLNGYLLINLHVVGYIIYQRWLGREPNPKWYLPFVFLSIAWAISIHTVTAFLYAGLGGRPFWNSALLAPRFLASAFVTGPAFIVLSLQVVKRTTDFYVPRAALTTLVSIIRVTAPINLFMLGAEVFSEFYAGGAHVASARYLFLGLHGHSELVPWIWTAISFNVFAAVVLLTPPLSARPWLLNLALMLTFVGVWIEKGMGLIVPGFIPSTLHEIVPYTPSLTEWKVMAGVWAAGLMVFTVGLRVALGAMTGAMRADDAPAEDLALAPDEAPAQHANVRGGH